VRCVVATTLKGIGATAIFATRDIDEALLVGDRVAVLTLRPATVSSVVDNALPFPRDPNDEEFQVLRILLHHQAYLAREVATTRSSPPASGAAAGCRGCASAA